MPLYSRAESNIEYVTSTSWERAHYLPHNTLMIVVRRCYDILFMHAENNYRPRVGVPWRTAAEEKAGERTAYKYYLDAVRDAGGEPVEVSLLQSDEELRRQAESLDAVL